MLATGHVLQVVVFPNTAPARLYDYGALQLQPDVTINVAI